ncbi:hypothetical protein [Jeongeupia naejangsanensis]|uniref:Alginate export domain-containing protein n=1 Tax=Jeongeupia naejangsanensis TaxID=613195 RepID=A0ABS2BQR7_9NEIS|nr:hypothetical protein [Jeongeupia naejangsanensis]MBM3117775.1 hypothetical protein [Jeongeupia naejangsanensis]
MKSLPLALLLAAAVAHADGGDADALALADATADAQTATRDWRFLTELAGASAQYRFNDQPAEARLSLDGRIDRRFHDDWRFVFADRLDLRSTGGHQSSVNTLKELYLGWQPDTDLLLDLGRINTRYGAGFGYNPTDFFKVGALRSVTSVNPASLRENRLGSVMLRGQKLWDGGSLTAMYSPKLADSPSDDAFNPDWGASNPQDRWLLAVSQSFGNDHGGNLNPQLLLYHDADTTQLGLNWSVLLGDATIVYAEWAGGRQPSVAGRAAGIDDTAFRNAASTGLTWTAAAKVTLTLEYQYDGAALDDAGWSALRSGPLPAYVRYRQLAAQRQDLTTRHAAMLYAQWQDALIRHVDLSGFVRQDLIDDSRLSWLEARWHGDDTDIALQWQYDAGETRSNYGGLPQRQIWQALLSHYF